MADLDTACDAIDEFARIITRRRYPIGSYVGGEYVVGDPTEIEIAAVHQPVTSRDLRDLPEGQRVDALRSVWSRSDIQGANESTGRLADELVIEGETYRVVRAWARTEAGFSKAVVELKDDRQRGK